MATGWTVNGNDLRRYGYDFNTRGGWDVASGTRGESLPVAYVDGGWMGSSSFLEENVLGFQMTVLGANPANGLVDGGKTKFEWLDDNLDAVKGFFAPEALDLRRTMPDGDVRQYYNARALNGISTRERGVGMIELAIPILVPEGTARDITNSVAGETDATNVNLTGSGSVNITTGGNVRTSPVLTLTADTNTVDPVITFPDGATLSYVGTIPAGQALVLDCADRDVTLNGANADAGLSSVGRRAYWGFLEPGGVNAVGYSVSSGQFDLSVQWYNRWR